MKPLLFGTSRIDSRGELEIGGCAVSQLMSEYGSPLYVYDVALIKEKISSLKKAFAEFDVAYRINYASKAFSCKAIYQLIKQEGLSIDVVSQGELYTALEAGMDPSRIEYHGNNKTEKEIRYALEKDVGYLILDNENDIYLVNLLAKELGKTPSVLFRVTPGVEAHTHEYIITGREKSKFGFDIQSGQAKEALIKVLSLPNLNLVGVHCHIGSQIFSGDGFEMATKKVMEMLLDWRKDYDFVAKIVNLGGGFGVKYTDADQPLTSQDYISSMVKSLLDICQESSYPVPEVWVEPGRYLVGEAGTSLYTVGSRKELEGVKTYVAVDGGMGDNIRPALYQAEYSGFVANKANEEAVERVAIVGRYCESGDQLIQDIELPKTQPGDIFAMTTTGAYGYSMASHYNRIEKPAVVFVEDGISQIVVRRETLQDLLQFDEDLQIL